MMKPTIESPKTQHIIRNKIGLPPGSLVYVGPDSKIKPEIERLSYKEDSFEHEVIEDTGVLNNLEPQETHWINLVGLHQVELMEQLKSRFDIHPLVMEDIMNTEHRPKVEIDDKSIFVLIKMLSVDETSNELKSEQVSLFLKDNVVVCFQEIKGDVFDSVRTRIREKKGFIRQKTSDYLLYSLIDAVVDHYYLCIEFITLKLDQLEDQIVEDGSKNILGEAQHLKKQLLTLKRSVLPLRDAISRLQKSESELIQTKTRRFISDTYDTIIGVIDAIDTQRETLNSIKEVYQSNLGNRMNNIMKVLTVMSSIFIPLTFIAGIYGMNFQHMPELASEYGYPLVWTAMILITGCMVLLFKRKGWI